MCAEHKLSKTIFCIEKHYIFVTYVWMLHHFQYVVKNIIFKCIITNSEDDWTQSKRGDSWECLCTAAISTMKSAAVMAPQSLAGMSSGVPLKITTVFLLEVIYK